MMDIKWKILFGKTLIWFVVEIMLNLVGMDDVADYSEFIFKIQGYTQQQAQELTYKGLGIFDQSKMCVACQLVISNK